MVEMPQVAAYNIRRTVEGLAREIGRRVAQQQQKTVEREMPEKIRDMPPGHDWGAHVVEEQASAVLLDYLLGDFNPVGERSGHD